MVKQSKLVSYAKSPKNFLNCYAPKTKRYFHRLQSGVYKWNCKNEKVKFISLTTAPNASERNIMKDLRKLVARIKSKNGKMEYCAVRTNEGYGVIHLLCATAYISQKWLSYNWNEIHKSPIVDIRIMKNQQGLSNYLCSQYLNSQKCSFTYLSYTAKWLFPNAIKCWKIALEKSRYWNAKNPPRFNPMLQSWIYSVDIKKAIQLWNNMLKKVANGISPVLPDTKYKSLSDYG